MSAILPVTVALGRDLLSLGDASGHAFAHAGEALPEMGVVVAPPPSALVWDDGERRIVFPEGQYLSLAYEALLVADVAVTPHMRSLTADEMVLLAADLDQMLEDAGLALAGERVSPASLQQKLAVPVEAQHRIAAFSRKSEGGTAFVGIAQPLAGEAGRYTLTVEISNRALARTLARIARALREEAGAEATAQGGGREVEPGAYLRRLVEGGHMDQVAALPL